jgi:NADH dehydrogenase FAD-containing subunit
MPKHLVLVGGGHAHLTMLANCRDYADRGIRVTLVSVSPYHYYSGMGPGLLAGTYRPQDIRFHIRKMVEDRGAGFVEDRVIRVDPKERVLFLESGRLIGYDIVSFNTGSDVVLPPGGQDHENVFPVKPIVSLLSARRAVIARLRQGRTGIAVIGGGPAGVEIAGNAWRLVQNQGGQAQITVIPGRELLPGRPTRLQVLARQSLLQRGIAVLDGLYAECIGKNEVTLTNGERLQADIVLVATGIRTSSLFKDSGLPTGPDGGLLVNRFLQSTAYPGIFGGGDAICFEPRPLAKVGVYAVRENKILFQNILAALSAGELVPFEPQQKFMLIFNMGNDRGILTRGLTKGDFVWDGWLPWKLKDRIDRSFMKKYQVSGERDEVIPEEKEEQHVHS